MLGQLSGHDVRGIGVGHRHEGLGAVRPGPAEDVLIDRRPEDHLAGKFLAQPVEGCLAGIHHRDVVSLFTQLPGQARSDPPAADDHRAHSLLD